MTSKSDGLELLAQPRTDEVKKYVKQVELSVGPERWSVRRVSIEENNGDQSVIVFGKIARDVKVDPARMRAAEERLISISMLARADRRLRRSSVLGAGLVGQTHQREATRVVFDVGRREELAALCDLAILAIWQRAPSASPSSRIT